MKYQSKEEALVSASILMECYKSSVGDHPWVRSNPEVAIAVESAILAMEAACESIGEEQLEPARV